MFRIWVTDAMRKYHSGNQSGMPGPASGYMHQRTVSAASGSAFMAWLCQRRESLSIRRSERPISHTYGCVNGESDRGQR